MKKPDTKFVKKLAWTCGIAAFLAILYILGLTFRSLFYMM